VMNPSKVRRNFWGLQRKIELSSNLLIN